MFPTNIRTTSTTTATFEHHSVTVYAFTADYAGETHHGSAMLTCCNIDCAPPSATVAFMHLQADFEPGSSHSDAVTGLLTELLELHPL